MTWPRSTTDPKYRTREHQAERAKWSGRMAAQGYLVCMQPVCIMSNRTIVNGETWHVGHDEGGTAYLGPVHAACNVKDGARRAGQKRKPGGRRWAL